MSHFIVSYVAQELSSIDIICNPTNRWMGLVANAIQRQGSSFTFEMLSVVQKVGGWTRRYF